MQARVLFLMMALALASAGCETVEDILRPAETTAFRCGSGTSFNARISPDEVRATFGGDASAVTLPRVPSASGEKYSDGRTTLWIKGGEAYVERDGKPLHFGCRAAAQ